MQWTIYDENDEPIAKVCLEEVLWFLLCGYGDGRYYIRPFEFLDKYVK